MPAPAPVGQGGFISSPDLPPFISTSSHQLTICKDNDGSTLYIVQHAPSNNNNAATDIDTDNNATDTDNNNATTGVDEATVRNVSTTTDGDRRTVTTEVRMGGGTSCTVTQTLIPGHDNFFIITRNPDGIINQDARLCSRPSASSADNNG